MQFEPFNGQPQLQPIGPMNKKFMTQKRGGRDFPQPVPFHPAELGSQHQVASHFGNKPDMVSLLLPPNRKGLDYNKRNGHY